MIRYIKSKAKQEKVLGSIMLLPILILLRVNNFTTRSQKRKLKIRKSRNNKVKFIKGSTKDFKNLTLSSPPK